MRGADLGRDLRIRELRILDLRILDLRIVDRRILVKGVKLVGLLWAGTLTGCGSDPSSSDKFSMGDDAASPSSSNPEPVESGGEPGADTFDAAFAVMTARCHECHNADTSHSFIVDSTAEATLASAVAAKAKIKMRINEPNSSIDRMPPTAPLSDEDLQTLNTWLDSL
jgi:mono/diheme cytochrome c family protein